MPDPLSQALRDWQTFYFMAGTASATLMGLMFIAASLGMHLVSEHEESVRTFVTPSLVHFTLVILVSMIMAVPTHSILTLGGALMLTGMASTAFSGQVIMQMVRQAAGKPIDPGHWLWHASLPLISYATIIGVAIWLLSGALTALSGLAIATVLLMVIGIHNAWDLVMWLAKNR